MFMYFCKFSAYFFTNRIINVWNSLPDTVVMSETVNQFKNRLDKFWSNQDLIYSYKAELTGIGSANSISIVSIFTYLSVLYDVDIEASACVLSSRYAVLMLCYGSVLLRWRKSKDQVFLLGWQNVSLTLLDQRKFCV